MHRNVHDGGGQDDGEGGRPHGRDGGQDGQLGGGKLQGDGHSQTAVSGKIFCLGKDSSASYTLLMFFNVIVLRSS